VSHDAIGALVQGILCTLVLSWVAVIIIIRKR
jgi:hypothetical protein